MYKPRYVTRTIKTKVATVLWLNLETNETHTDEAVVPGHLSSEGQIIEYVNYLYGSSRFKSVHVVCISEKEARYKITEEDFIKHAEIEIVHVEEGENEE